MNIRLSILLIVAAALGGCEKTITLDLDQTRENIVIEGLVTDRPGRNYVKVSRTSGFYTTGKTPRITDATVQVEDSDGNIFSFVHNPSGHADSAGYYRPETPLAGQINKAYTLTVVADGRTFSARDSLVRLVPIDRLEYRIDPDEQQDPGDPGRFYEVLLTVREPRESRDYYLFHSYRNGKLEFANETDIYYADDELIAENINGIPLPVYYAENDEAEIVVYSLTRDAFIYYRDLQKLLANDGGMFGTPPANPRSNLTNGALGFFQVSAVQSGKLTITE